LKATKELMNSDNYFVNIQLMNSFFNAIYLYIYFHFSAFLMTPHPAVRSLHPNLQSGSIFVSLGETFRREGRNEKESLIQFFYGTSAAHFFD